MGGKEVSKAHVQGWDLTTVGKVAEINKKSITPSTDPETEIKYLDISSIEETGKVSKLSLLRFKDAPSRAKRIVLHEDILVSTVRPYLRAFAFIENPPPNLIASTGYAVLSPKKYVEPRFIYQNILSENFINYLILKMKGSNYPAVNASDISNYSFLLPPLPEQKKIAEILSSVDEAIQSTQAVIDQTQKVKKGLLQQLLTKGIGHTKFKQTEIGEIPESWEVVTIGDTLSSSTYGINLALNHDTLGVPVLRMGNIKNNLINLSDLKYANVSELDISKHLLSPDDIVFNRTNSYDLVGKVGFVETKDTLSFASYLIRLRVNHARVVSKWLYYNMISESTQKKIKSLATLGVSQANINPTNLKKLQIALPPNKEQWKIVKILENLDKAIYNNSNCFVRLEYVKQGLMSDLLTGRVRVKV